MKTAEYAVAAEEIPGGTPPPDNATADTLYRLGKSLTDGVTPKDPVLGNEYLKKAYAMGDIRAAVLYGRSYLMGTGVFLDYVKAAELFNLGILKGNEDAKFFLGLMKYFGMGLPLDKEEGLWEITSAAAGGSGYAEEYLKIVATEDILEYLSLPHKREEIKTYLLSAGASLKTSEGLCDLYDLRGAVSSDYALISAKICAGAAKQNIIFEYLKDIDPLYNARLTRYTETEGYRLISSQ
jgi:TPR repeat protein